MSIQYHQVGVLSLGLALLMSACSMPEDRYTTVNKNIAVSIRQDFSDFRHDQYFPYLMNQFLAEKKLPDPLFHWPEEFDPFIAFEDFGHFQNEGSTEYRYALTKPRELRKHIPAGVMPNRRVVSPLLDQDGQPLNLSPGDHWQYTRHEDLALAYEVWIRAHEHPATKAFFIGEILERAGLLRAALLSYYSILVHDPDSVVWSADGSFVWYTAPVAMGRIRNLCWQYPDLACELEGAMFKIQNGEDTNLDNDIITHHPGRLIRKDRQTLTKNLPQLNERDVIQKRGSGRVQLWQYKNKHWQMRVDEQPFYIHGISYYPTKIGIGPHNDVLYQTRWMFDDHNQNGIIDAPFESWLDQNRNGQQDRSEPAVGDFALMRDMGVNAIRMFLPNDPDEPFRYDPKLVNKELLRNMYEEYGIMVIAADFLGAYTVGSGASWDVGTDYRDPVQRQRMKELVRQKVIDLKDEPFILMWLLGNENNFAADYMGANATRTNAADYPEAYASLLQEVATMIKALDPDRPVAVGNIETGLLDAYREHAPALDILGINAYRGPTGFGRLWDDVQQQFDRPVLITEYGIDAYEDQVGEADLDQKEYIRGALRDIVLQQAGGPGVGNSLGGVLFQYVDEWWKDTFGDPEDQQNTEGFRFDAAPDGVSHEEWYGIMSQGSGQNSPFERRLRSAYVYLKELHQGFRK